jgi:class 3 adenylate cyclase
MASFDDVVAAVECTRTIQQAFDAFNLASRDKLRVRIGLDAGEPVADSNDLFGTTVQMAARLCQTADPDTILVSRTVREMAGSQFEFVELGARSLKGFAKEITPFEVIWR